MGCYILLVDEVAIGSNATLLLSRSSQRFFGVPNVTVASALEYLWSVPVVPRTGEPKSVIPHYHASNPYAKQGSANGLQYLVTNVVIKPLEY